MATRNSKQLESFVEYCQAHPEERFWQAIRNWSGTAFIFKSNMPAYALFLMINKKNEDPDGQAWNPDELEIHDTFYDEDE